jgi:hypothetical protein
MSWIKYMSTNWLDAHKRHTYAGRRCAMGPWCCWDASISLAICDRCGWPPDNALTDDRMWPEDIRVRIFPRCWKKKKHTSSLTLGISCNNCTRSAETHVRAMEERDEIRRGCCRWDDDVTAGTKRCCPWREEAEDEKMCLTTGDRGCATQQQHRPPCKDESRGEGCHLRKRGQKLRVQEDVEDQ